MKLMYLLVKYLDVLIIKDILKVKQIFNKKLMLDGKNLFYNELGVFILKFKNYFFASYLKYYF